MARGLERRRPAAPRTALAEALDALAVGVAVRGADGTPLHANPAHADLAAALAETPADAACVDAGRPAPVTARANRTPGAAAGHVRAAGAAASPLHAAGAAASPLHAAGAAAGHRCADSAAASPLHAAGPAASRLHAAGAAVGEVRAADGRRILRRRAALPSGGLVETLTDVTAARRREAELAAARQRAEAAVRARAQFIAVMSHELRTPMNGVLGFAGLLAMSDLDDRQRRWLAQICESGEVLLRILNAILDLAALETGGLQMDAIPMDPGAPAGLAAAAHLGAALGKGIALSVRAAPDLPPQVLGDPRRLEQALALLIDNAVKFTAQGEVVVSVTAGPPALGRVPLRYEVRDTGPGVAPEALGHLFDAFTQADSSATRSHGGVGVGLALCRRLAEAMGGAVEADSAPGRGARFAIRIAHPLPG